MNGSKQHTSTYTSDVVKSDIIWLLAGWCWNQLHPDILKQKKIVVTEHHIVPEKFWAQKAEAFKLRDQFVNAYHTPNIKTAKFIRPLTTKPIYIIPYWLDTSIWFPEDKNSCRKIFNIPNNKFVVGSFQRDTEGGTCLPKLEKGPDLFIQYLRALDRKDLHVLLGGWRREYICGKLNEHKISYSKFERVPIDTVRKMYGACDLYVVSSRYEGGPQAIYEASAMKIPIISRDVGVATEVLCSNCIVDIPNEIYYPTPEDIEMNFKNVLSFDIKYHKQTFHKMLEETLTQ